MSMICPICRAIMTGFRERGVDLDRCTGCGGVWFDPGELEAHDAHASSGIEFVPRPESDALVCPRCDAPELALGQVGLLCVHRCSRCHGCFVPTRLPERGAEAGYGVADAATDVFHLGDVIEVLVGAALDA